MGKDGQIWGRWGRISEVSGPEFLVTELLSSGTSWFRWSIFLSEDSEKLS